MLFIKWSNNSESWVVRKKDTILSKGLEAELNQAKVSDFSRGFSMNGRWFRKITGEIVKFESWRLELKLGDNGENKPLKFGRNRKWGATVALKLVGDWHDKSRCFGKIGVLICCSVTQLCLTLCDPHRLQHARLPCPSPSPGACSNSCPLSQWCHPTISSSVVPFSFSLQFFPASGSINTRMFMAVKYIVCTFKWEGGRLWTSSVSGLWDKLCSPPFLASPLTSLVTNSW